MRTYEQLMKHYWGVIVPMAESAGINPWECVRVNGSSNYDSHPGFVNYPGEYTFALTVLEKHPVFVGDKLYVKNGGNEIIVNDNYGTHSDWCNATCTPPTKKRTFMLNGVELPCPVVDGKYSFDISGHFFGFDSFSDMQTVRGDVMNLLDDARDKE